MKIEIDEKELVNLGWLVTLGFIFNSLSLIIMMGVFMLQY